MNIVIIKENKLIFKKKELELSDLLTDECYKFCEEQVKRYKNDLYVVNEVYLNTVQPVLAIILFFKKNNIEIVKFKHTNRNLYSMVMDAAYVCQIKTLGTDKYYKLVRIIVGYLYTYITAAYLIVQMILRPYSGKMESNIKFSVIRTPAAKKKMSFLKDISVKYEYLKENISEDLSIYNCFHRKMRIWWAILSWFYSYRELKKIRHWASQMIGPYSGVELFYFYSKRITHTLLYEYLLNAYFRKFIGKIYFTGNNLDRFSLIEEHIAKKYNIIIVCIPHGLEYGFKLPHCFVGDIFYATSKQTALHLNSLYHTEKFVYDSAIAKKMFSVHENGDQKTKIVFFTEPREVNVNLNILKELLPIMEKENMKLYLKLHPKDQKSNYLKYESNIAFIDDFNEAISHNICFSRKSTALLEAIYNNSKAAAILINSKDKAVFYTFPSLQEKKIKVFDNTQALFEWLKKEWLKKETRKKAYKKFIHNSVYF
ncbi:hypothetical protein [Anaerosacchariphilus polymeriproducens]|uniref:Uncharacterized protein n=1 Tax=Anaerosacchariphilus polymeriproducens TaxID=1812858 RepID=A0A371AR07_9FIRM|nr:hypothetical protein [Anaerosacchariphilus polymeriproducens]RDU21998.1 hypothetical protein DWV06_15815 [Anaerosacchariphilus polymeriproducens]